MIVCTISLCLLSAQGSTHLATGSFFLANLYIVLLPVLMYLFAEHADGYLSLYLSFLLAISGVGILQFVIWIVLGAAKSNFDGMQLMINIAVSSLCYAILA